MSTKNILILIQGPLISYGQGPNNSLLGFNAEETIIANSNIFKNYNIENVVVTWETHNADELLIIKNLETIGIRILILTPPANNDYDHRFKHHYALMTAFNTLKADSYDYIGKIRTDQLLIENFTQFLISYNSEKILISELMKDNDFYIGDFIYYGKSNKIIPFIKSQLKRKFIHTIIANDIGMKYYASNKKIMSFFLLLNYLFKPTYINKEWVKFINENIETIHSSIWQKINWRGKEMGSIIDKKNFLFTNDVISTKPRRIYFNTTTYFNGLIIYAKKAIKYFIKKYF